MWRCHPFDINVDNSLKSKCLLFLHWLYINSSCSIFIVSSCPHTRHDRKSLHFTFDRYANVAAMIIGAVVRAKTQVVSSFPSYRIHVQVRATRIVVACRLVSPYRPYHVLSGRGSSFVRLRVKIPRCRYDHKT